LIPRQSTDAFDAARLFNSVQNLTVDVVRFPDAVTSVILGLLAGE